MKRMLIAAAIVLSLSACTTTVIKSPVERDAAYAKAVEFCGKKDDISYFFYKPQINAFKVYCMDGRGREL